MINTTHKIPTLFHYDISLKHTFSQILQQEIFLNSTQTKIKTTSCQILPFATIPTRAPMPTGFQIPHRLRPQLCQRPLEDIPEQPQFQNSLLHLPIKDYPPHAISVMTEIISL